MIRVLCNIGYPSQTLLNSNLAKSRSSITSVWIIQSTWNFAKFQVDWIIQTDVMDEPDFARSKFEMSLGRISYTATPPPPPPPSRQQFSAMGSGCIDINCIISYSAMELDRILSLFTSFQVQICNVILPHCFFSTPFSSTLHFGTRIAR